MVYNIQIYQGEWNPDNYRDSILLPIVIGTPLSIHPDSLVH